MGKSGGRISVRFTILNTKMGKMFYISSCWGGTGKVEVAAKGGFGGIEGWVRPGKFT